MDRKTRREELIAERDRIMELLRIETELEAAAAKEIHDKKYAEWVKKFAALSSGFIPETATCRCGSEMATIHCGGDGDEVLLCKECGCIIVLELDNTTHDDRKEIRSVFVVRTKDGYESA